jgi:uncharacterized protein YndB with AHSA1/START domain
MIDIINQINATYRQVAQIKSSDNNEEHISVLMRRDYGSSIEEVWSALTKPDRIKRWFLPISGELQVGGSFQLESNAGGEILTCQPPNLLRVTFGGPTSIVEVRLTAQGESGTILELEHTVPIEMAQSGAGALYVGPGWDVALMGLDLFLRGQVISDSIAAANSPKSQEFSKYSVHAWIGVIKASGTATEEQLTAATEISLGQFAPAQSTLQDQ